MAWPSDDARGQHVGGRASRARAMPAHVPPGDGQRAEQAAVEDAAALEDREHLARVGDVVAPLDDHQQQLRAEQARDQDVDAPGR